MMKGSFVSLVAGNIMPRTILKTKVYFIRRFYWHYRKTWRDSMRKIPEVEKSGTMWGVEAGFQVHPDT